MKKKLLSYTFKGRTYTSETDYYDWEEVIGIDIDSWQNRNLENNEPFSIIFQHEEAPSGYTDISSIENWDRFGYDVVNDYLVVKDQIKYLMLDIGWSGLTHDEKIICIHYYALPDFEQPVMFLMTEMGLTQSEAMSYVIEHWHIHHKKLLEVCRERWFYVKLIVVNYLNFSDAEELMDLANPLIFNFIESGRFGIDYGDKRSGLLDFITSKYNFDGQGLREQGYDLNYGTYDELIDKMVNVLLHGMYTKINI